MVRKKFLWPFPLAVASGIPVRICLGHSTGNKVKAGPFQSMVADIGVVVTRAGSQAR